LFATGSQSDQPIGNWQLSAIAYLKITAVLKDVRNHA
jgi:hypothetical protein